MPNCLSTMNQTLQSMPLASKDIESFLHEIGFADKEMSIKYFSFTKKELQKEWTQVQNIIIKGFPKNTEKVLRKALFRLDIEETAFSNIQIVTKKYLSETVKKEAMKCYGMIPPDFISFRHNVICLSSTTNAAALEHVLYHEYGHALDIALGIKKTGKPFSMGIGASPSVSTPGPGGSIIVSIERYNPTEWFAVAFATYKTKGVKALAADEIVLFKRILKKIQR